MSSVARPGNYLLPPQVLAPDGQPRRVGVEIEFAATEPGAIAGVLEELYGGRSVQQNPHRFRVFDTRLGTFTVELDTQYAHPDSKKPQPTGQSDLDLWIDREIELYLCSLIGDISRMVVPYEIITPPIAVDRLSELDSLMNALHTLGAEGTDENLFYAFGVHLNPQAPFLTAESILAHLRALIVLSDWLNEALDIDLTRKVLPYIRAFPKDYALRILDWDYAPDLSQLIDDYLEENPTRNRELDLIPLFLHLDENRVRSRIEDELSSGRPTYHYRLPDCRLNDPEWSLAREWNYWVEIERLAADSERLQTISRAYVEHHTKLISWNWSEKVQQWMPKEKPGR